MCIIYITIYFFPLPIYVLVLTNLPKKIIKTNTSLRLKEIILYPSICIYRGNPRALLLSCLFQREFDILTWEEIYPTF